MVRVRLEIAHLLNLPIRKTVPTAPEAVDMPMKTTERRVLDMALSIDEYTVPLEIVSI